MMKRVIEATIRRMKIKNVAKIRMIMKIMLIGNTKRGSIVIVNIQIIMILIIVTSING